MRTFNLSSTFGLSLALILAASQLQADDWPNWRGPNHNGISAETGWLAKWPANGPAKLWKASVGLGFSSVAVANGRAPRVASLFEEV